MMRRRVVGLAVMLAVAAVPLAAQQGQGRQGGMEGGMMRGMAAPNLEELATELRLDEAQQVKVKELLARFETETKAPRETLTGNMQMVREGSVTMDAVRDQNAAAMAKVREQRDLLNKEIRAVLTAEQQAAFDRWLEARRARGPGGGGRPPQ